MNQNVIKLKRFLSIEMKTIGGDDTIHYPGNFECFPFTHSCIEQLKEKYKNFLIYKSARDF